MAPGGSTYKEALETNSKGFDYEVKMAKTDSNNNKPAKATSASFGKYAIHNSNGVYELLECLVCTNLMYPPIHQVSAHSSFFLSPITHFTFLSSDSVYV